MCEKYYYSIQPFTNMQGFKNKETTRPTLTLKFVLPTGRHEHKEQVEKGLKIQNGSFSYEIKTFQYIIYDWNSFIADLGGYLGLLVGQSIFGVYLVITDWVGRQSRKCTTLGK